MKIAISANGTSLDADVEPRFGRCPYFIVVDPTTMAVEVLDNADNAGGGGAGIATAQMLSGAGVDTIITGNYGPNAQRVLAASGIEVISGASGNVRRTVEEYKLGTFAVSQRATVPDHFGLRGGVPGHRGGRAGRHGRP
jgi:predicted Fe-Mo cluster-binding NifX family protein